MRKFGLLFLLLTLLCSLRSQPLTGKVLQVNENGDTVVVANAAAQWLHTSIGAHTDADGKFSLPRTRTDTLVISFPTFLPDTVVIPARVRTDTVILRGEPVLIEDTAFITELVPVNDTTYIVKTTIKADTIIKQVPVSKYVVKDNTKTTSIFEWTWIIFSLIAYIVLGFLVIRALCKKL